MRISFIVAVLLAASGGGRGSNNDLKSSEPQINYSTDTRTAAPDDAFKKLKDAILAEIRLEVRNWRRDNEQKLNQVSKDITSEVTQRIKELSKDVKRARTEIKQLGSDLKRGTLISTSLGLKLRNVTERLASCVEAKKNVLSRLDRQQQHLQQTNATDRRREEVPTSMPKAMESGCKVNVTATDLITESVVNGSCVWNFNATRGKEVLLSVHNSSVVDCSRDGLYVFTDGQRVPDICRRLQNRSVAMPLWGSNITVRYRPAPNRKTAATIELRHRARSDISRIKVWLLPPNTLVIHTKIIPLARGERTWLDVRRKTKRIFPSRIDGTELAANVGWLYHHEQAVRRCIFNTDGECRDEVDGRLVPERYKIHFFMHFLLPESPVRSCPGCVPDLFVLISTQVMKTVATNPPRLQVTDVSSLRDPKYVLLLEEYSHRLLTKVGTGTEKVATQTISRKAQKVFIALRHGDAIPKFDITPNKTIVLYARFGVRLQVENSRLRRRGSANPRDATWVQLNSRSAIVADVRAAMRR